MDGKIDECEQKFLLDFCREFLRKSPNLLIESEIDENLIRHGVCSMCPDIQFTDRMFCFTGRSRNASRKVFADMVVRLGGQFSLRINNMVNYLVIGGEGNKAWAFSCYGRKVEQAVNLRKEGIPIQIVHEFDFWDAVEESR